MSRPYAEVIGDPIAHSKSPIIHRFWLEKLGIEGDYRAVQVRQDMLAEHLENRRADPHWRGSNVTAPLKIWIMGLVDFVTPDAGEIGAVNAVVPSCNLLFGYNTDGQGFLEPLGPIIPDNGGMAGDAIVYGTGGAAKAIVHALRRCGVSVQIAARAGFKAQELAIIAGYPWADWIKAESDKRAPLLQFTELRHGEIALLVNATPLGSQGQPPLDITLDRLTRNVTVYDIVYDPLETPLLAEARRRGMPTIDGVSMLIAQAARAFELFFRAPAPRQYDADLRALLTR